MLKRSFGTHDGSFHADEVTACALLLLFDLIDKDKIVRTRDEKKLGACEYVCDVGGIYDPPAKRFDHHQPEYQGEMSSAGMTWLYLLDSQVIEQPLYHYFNRQLLIGIDGHDNGKVGCALGWCNFSHVVAGFAPIVYDASDEEQTRAFFVALDFVYHHLKRMKQRFNYIQSCKAIVKETMNQGKSYLFFDKALSWIDPFFELGGAENRAQFVVMPSGGQWKVRGIPKSGEERMSVRRAHPKEWGGLRDEELVRVSGVSGAVFCHKGLFISVWKTKEQALAAVKRILEETA